MPRGSYGELPPNILRCASWESEAQGNAVTGRSGENRQQHVPQVGQVTEQKKAKVSTPAMGHIKPQREGSRGEGRTTRTGPRGPAAAGGDTPAPPCTSEIRLAAAQSLKPSTQPPGEGDQAAEAAAAPPGGRQPRAALQRPGEPPQAPPQSGAVRPRRPSAGSPQLGAPGPTAQPGPSPHGALTESPRHQARPPPLSRGLPSARPHSYLAAAAAGAPVPGPGTSRPRACSPLA